MFSQLAAMLCGKVYFSVSCQLLAGLPAISQIGGKPQSVLMPNGEASFAAQHGSKLQEKTMSPY
jgi:hypothetical protein